MILPEYSIIDFFNVRDCIFSKVVTGESFEFRSKIPEYFNYLIYVLMRFSFISCKTVVLGKICADFLQSIVHCLNFDSELFVLFKCKTCFFRFHDGSPLKKFYRVFN